MNWWAWLVNHDFRIIDEAILKKMRSSMRSLWSNTVPCELKAMELRFGPYLMREQGRSLGPKVVQGSGEIKFCLGAGPS